MFPYFWLEGDQLPAGIGFGLFTWKHLLMDGLCATGILGVCLLFAHAPVRRQRRWLKIHAVLLLGGNGLRDLVLLAIGRFGMNYLPLHLCSTAIFVYLIHAFLPERYFVRNASAGTACRAGQAEIGNLSSREVFIQQSGFREALGEIGFVLLMPGTIAALIFPDWTMYPLMNFMSLHSFVWHAMLITYPVMLRISGRIHPSIRHIWYPVVYLCIIVPPTLLFDKANDVNYLFVNWPLAGTPLAWLYSLLGKYWLAGYAILVFVVILGIYLMIELVHRLGRGRKLSHAA